MALALLATALLAPAAQAATFTVNTLVDGADQTPGNGVCQTTTPGQCTFRAAVEEANGLSGDDSINFSVTGVHPITVAAGGNVSMVGGSAGNLTITGNGSGSSGTVLDAQGASGISRVFNANGTGSTTTTISSLRVRGINAASSAGIGSNGGILNLDHVVVTGNTGGSGAGVATSGTLNITDSTISANTNTSGAPGAGIAASGVLTLVRSTVSGNTTTGGGGGTAIFTGGSGSSIINSTISGNTGSGVAVIRNDAATLFIRNSTIAGNTAAGTATLVGNAAISIGNSIVSSSGPACSGTVASAGNNVVSDGTCASVSSDKTSANPQLAALADNGGPTQTMAITNSSPAFDSGDSSLCATGPVSNLDQRGITRPQFTACDIGAFELQKAVVPTTPNPPKPTHPDNSFAIGKLKLKANGTAILAVTVPGAGTIAVSDTKKMLKRKLVKPVSAQPKAATTVKLKLKPTARAKAMFADGKRVKTTLRITFTPSGGSTNVKPLVAKLKRGSA